MIADPIVTRAPGPLGIHGIEQYGGAAARVRPEDTAFPHRDAQFNLLAVGSWPDAAEDEERIAWVRGMWQTMQPFSQTAVYMNFLGDTSEGADRVRAGYGAHYDRLAAVKATYDPTNFLHRNQNILPNKQPSLAAIGEG